MDFTTSLLSVGLLIMLAVPGFILKKMKLITENASSVFAAVLIYVSQPFLTLQSFTKTEYSQSILKNIGIVFALAFILMIVAYCICRLLFLKIGSKDEKNSLIACGFLSNCAFMGIPVLQALFPGETLPMLYCAVFVVVFNLFAWTLLIYLITGDKKNISLKKAFINPPLIALLISLPIFFTNTVIPAPLMKGVDFLANITSPLAMMVIGIKLASIRMRELFTSLKIYFTSLTKLVLVPFISFSLLYLINAIYPIDKTVISTIFIVMAMPTATSVTLFQERYHKDSHVSVKCILLSSILSILTVPTLALLLNLI